MFNISIAAYDRYAFRRLEDEVNVLGLTIPFVEHPQGGTRRGKPAEGMSEGLWMPGSVRLVEEALLERRLRLKRSPVLVSAIMSAVTDEDRWGNHWLTKERAVNKIDCAVALCMALGAAMHSVVAVPVCPWDDPNFRLVA